jgi:uncharacterized protein YacL
MAKIDEVKETLNTFRVLFSLGIGAIIALAGAVSVLYDNENFGLKFYLAIISINILIVLQILILRFVFKKTKELRDL